MDFEWDDKKSRANLSKHGIDFKTATKLWRDENRVEIEANFPDENRKILIGKIVEKIWAAIFTSHKKEINLYEQEKNGQER